MHKTIIIFCISLAVICLAAPGMARQANGHKKLKKARFHPARHVGTITSDLLDEASGLAVSHQNEDILWMINDSGNPALLFAVRTSGKLVDTFSISLAIDHRSGSLFVTSEGIPASIFCLQPKESGKVKEDNFLLGR